MDDRYASAVIPSTLGGFDAGQQTDPIVKIAVGLISNWWGAFMCVAVSIRAVYIFRRCFKQQGRPGNWLSRNAHAAYRIHGLVITSSAIAIADAAFCHCSSLR